ncbi:MAG: glutathione transferase GstA [Rhodospirillales bacterium]
MKLYFSPGACSLSPHIALSESGLKFDLVQVDLKAHKTKSGDDFYKINPNGYVPALQTDDGHVLTEGPAIVQYIADKAAGKKLAPANGSFERYHLQEWLNFISTELHKGFSPLFNPATPDAMKQPIKDKLLNRFTYVDKQLAGKQYLLGNDFSVADGYLFTMCQWAAFMQVPVDTLPNLKAWRERVAARPAVQAALKTEADARKAA